VFGSICGVSTLRSALDELQAEDLRFAGDDELEADFGELERSADLLLAERARRLAEIDRWARTAGTGTCRYPHGWPGGSGWPSRRPPARFASTLSVRELRRAVAYWRQAADHRRAEENAEWLFGLRRLHASPTLDGMVRVDGDLDPETGETLITALRCVQDADMRSGDAPDMRTSAQRRADALGTSAVTGWTGRIGPRWPGSALMSR